MQYLEIEPQDMGLRTTDTDFPMLVPRGFADRMERGNPKDPLLLQVLPMEDEDNTTEGYCLDPLGEAAATIAPGVLHKYSGRVLLVATAACPIHCRYCFRRHFPYSESMACGVNLDQAIASLHDDNEITEVILSGGDPLMLSNPYLQAMIDRLERIEHLQRLRIHSRMPIILPERIDQETAATITSSRLKVVLVTHCNHANELNHHVQQALNTLTENGITILNQSVLLREINDNPDALKALSEKLFSFGVLPYYLHMLDRVDGAAHFAVATTRALSLHRQLQNILPGYLVPRLVYEKTGAKSKLLLS